MRFPQEIRRNMQIVKSFAIYLGSSILSKMIPFLLLPVMAKYLSPEEYGALSIYLIFITLYGAFIGMALHTNVSRNFYKVPKEELSIYIGNIFYVLMSTFMIYFILTYVLMLFFETIFSISTQWLLLLPIISVMGMVNELNTTILRNEQ